MQVSNACDSEAVRMRALQSPSLILTAGLLKTASRIIGLTVPGLCAVLTLGSLATGNTMAGMQSEFSFIIFFRWQHFSGKYPKQI